MRLVLIGVAGAAGALSRYGIGQAVGERSFPWSTLAINVVGSFLLGLLLASAVVKGWSPDLVAMLGTGFLGAFTTFSTFTVETVSMARHDRAPAALAYVALSIMVGFAAAYAGQVVGERAVA